MKKKRMGRPPKPKTMRKGKRLELRLTEAEYRELKAKADAKEQTVSEFLRDCGKD